MPRASGLGDELKKALGATIELIAGSNGIFVVQADGRQIFSKAQEGRFPEPGEVLERLKAGA